MSADEADSAAQNAAARTRAESVVRDPEAWAAVAAAGRRLTPTERLHEVTMAAMTRAATPPEHSADVSRNAKGHYQFSVTVRGYDLDEVIAKAKEAADQLAEHFPYPNGGEE